MQTLKSNHSNYALFALDERLSSSLDRLATGFYKFCDIFELPSQSVSPDQAIKINNNDKSLINDLSNIEFNIDHLAIRTNDFNTFHKWCDLLWSESLLMSDNMINGRPIHIYELSEAFDFCGFMIDTIELIAPSNKHSVESEGFEHLEIYFPQFDIDNVSRVINPLLIKAKQYGFKGKYKKQTPMYPGSLPDTSLTIEIPVGKTRDIIQENQQKIKIKLHTYHIKDIIDSEIQASNKL